MLEQWSSGRALLIHGANGGAYSPSKQGTAELLDCRKVSELAERKGILVIIPCYIYIWQV